MKFTLDWLKQYVDLDLPTVELSHRLTMAGLEVEAVEELFEGLEGVRVGRVIEVLPHPNADKLVLCNIEVGSEIKRVVCGAPNARAGMLTAIALPGAKLPSGLKIGQSKIRGEVSEGMLCSEKDLNISEDHLGIMDLPLDLESGLLLVEALLLRDTLIEVDLTPNRPDCTSVIGIAREAGAFVHQKIVEPISSDDLPELSGDNISFSVSVESVKDCPRYAARLLTGVTIGPSPWWLKRRLLSIGLRPINNVVDITNFVMLEYGQPLHAFDFQKLAQGRIEVRRAKKDEKITTLDGTLRDLDTDMLIICDGEKPVAVAGVMGAENSEVSEQTTEILLEAACFNPVTIRKSARLLGLGTDASYRFERGVDPELAPKAMERAVQLLGEITGAKVVDGGIDYCDGVKAPTELTLRVARTADLLGVELDVEKAASLLDQIDIPSVVKTADTLLVKIPSFRVDLEREIDLVEEIARLIGYNEIPTSLPMVPMSFPDQDKERHLHQRLTSFMPALGFYEAINYSFVAIKHFDMLGLNEGHAARSCVQILNPLADEQGVMRTMLLPGVLENVRRNINHQNVDLRLFEIGKVFLPTNVEQPHENFRLAAVMTGRRHPQSPVVHFGSDKVDLIDMKGVAAAILDKLQLSQVTMEGADGEFAVPGTCLRLSAGDQMVGELGELNADLAAEFGIKQKLFYLDLDLELLTELPTTVQQFVPLSRFPSVRWDLAIVVGEEVAVGDLLSTLEGAGEPLVEKVELFDIYRGTPIDEGEKSVALAVTYRSGERTLDDITVDKVHKKLTKLVLDKFQGKLRDI